MQLDEHSLPILDQFSEEGFVDLVFRISQFESDEKKYRFHLAASHVGQEVGMNVEMLKGIQGGLYEDKNEDLQLVQEHVYHNSVRFMRSGSDSDDLISAIGGLYDLTSGRLRMVENQSFTAIALHEGTLDFDSQIVNLKLFGNDDEDAGEDEYFECFFNVDLRNRLAYWNEKDQDYRKPLIKVLGSAAS